MKARRILASVLASLTVLGLSACVAPLPPMAGWQTATPVTELPEEVGPPMGACPWSPGGDDVPVAHDVSDEVAAVDAIALDQGRFWMLVESVPSRPVRADFEAVSSELAGCGLADIVAFQARLTLALYALDGPANMRWYEENDPLGIGFVSDDVFLYARCATVLGGRETWSRAVADETLEWGSDAPDVDGMAEFLLYVANDAALARGVSTEEYYDAVSSAVPISFESGSNTALWR